MGYAFDQLSGRVTDAAIAVHREPGPGSWESGNSPNLITKRVVLDHQPSPAHSVG